MFRTYDVLIIGKAEVNHRENARSLSSSWGQKDITDGRLKSTPYVAGSLLRKE